MDEATISLLPPVADLETRAVLKALAPAHRYLAELKGLAATIPNEHILINTLALQEAKDSSEIENVITTHDELYKADIFADYIKNPAAKEVSRYATALKTAFSKIKHDRLISVNRIIEMHQVLEQNDAGIRKIPGTALKNEQTDEIVYTPPQDHTEIVKLMNNLEQFINDDTMYNVDPLIKMAIIHHQFESIHPFYDGNGRTGRIINILYLVAKKLLDIPVLYLSRYIIRNKSDYYHLLQFTRETGDWEPWILYMLSGIELTARQTIWIIQRIKKIMMSYKHQIRSELPKIYSQDLLNNLFRHPYTKIESVQADLSVSRITATKYLEKLTAGDFIQKHKIGRYNYYVNRPLMNIFTDIPDIPKTEMISKKRN
jgi:Fic family protein